MMLFMTLLKHLGEMGLQKFKCNEPPSMFQIIFSLKMYIVQLFYHIIVLELAKHD